jgi:chaperonin GroES
MPRPKSQAPVVEKKLLGLRPLMGYLLVEPLAAETTTLSGIVLPESAQEKPAQGTVLAIGPDIVLGNGQLIMSPVQIGDKVVYKKWGGDEIKIHGVEYKLVKFEDLMGVLE